MKRRSLVSLMMAGTLAMSLAGCSGGGNTGNEAKPSETQAGTETTAADTKTETAKTSSNEKTVITVWTNDRHDSEYVEAKIDEFNATNDIKILNQLQC